jgi:hypothetical protein
MISCIYCGVDLISLVIELRVLLQSKRIYNGSLHKELFRRS